MSNAKKTMGPDDFTETTVVSHRTDLLATELSETERVMLDADQGKYFGVEGVANDIWAAMSTPAPVGAILDTVIKKYDVERSAAASDVKEFLAQVVNAGLAEISDGA